MTFVEMRNAMVKKLWDYLGCPVVLANQVQPEAPFPFVIYSVTTPYIPDNTMGDYRTLPDREDSDVVRRVTPTATFSFTCCSMNRGEDGAFISGADEAYELADEAMGWFLHTGYMDISALGITVVEVGQVQDRTTLVIDEAARRFGFDVQIRYTREDTLNVPSIKKVTIKKE